MARAATNNGTKGFKELQLTLNNLASAMSGGKKSSLKKDVYDVLFKAAGKLKQNIQSEAASKQVPEEVINSVFAYGDPTKDKKEKPRALVGVNKQKTMEEWTAKATPPTTPRNPHKVPAGGKVAESLAAMYEQGTSQMEPRPFFTPTVDAFKKVLRTDIEQGLKALIEEYTKK